MIPRKATIVIGVLLVGAARAASDWQSLIENDSLAQWKSYGKTDDAPVTWKVDHGVVTKGGGSIATKERFDDFDLELEWKISAGGNSGVMFGVDEKSDKPWHSGPEIQILDDAVHRDGKNPATRSGAIYSLYPPATSPLKPVGEWNSLRLRVQAGRVQVWLNGELVNDQTMGSADWNARVAKSKFAPFTQFGHVSPGRILLQDHGDPVWFRNIRVRRL